MSGSEWLLLFSGVVAGATPILLAALGETLTEKAGVINLSLDGTILLAAMVAFAVAFETQSAFLGCIAACLVGALVAAAVGLFSLKLGQSQVAVGFVLTLTARDLAYFLGNPYARLHGPQFSSVPIPILSDIPVLGPVLFQHNRMVYAGLGMIVLCWAYIYRTPMGLRLRAVGEDPRAAFARGENPVRLQWIYTMCGGFLVGAAGAAFSLFVKPGWGRPQGAEGTGWIALALVIFGGWHPMRAAAGAYLFSFLQVLGIYFQGWIPTVPAQVFQVALFPLMIFTLLIIAYAQRTTIPREDRHRLRLKALLEVFSGAAPSALGKPLRPGSL
ncbi:MAG: ABC transporter permease [Deltaproteobacteria bacterium]|nr:ABC transporter permease [Deltaproteobacteria bacterium]